MSRTEQLFLTCIFDHNISVLLGSKYYLQSLLTNELPYCRGEIVLVVLVLATNINVQRTLFCPKPWKWNDTFANVKVNKNGKYQCPAIV